MSAPGVVQAVDVLVALADGSPQTLSKLLTETEPPLLIEGLRSCLASLVNDGYVEEVPSWTPEVAYQLTAKGRRLLEQDSIPDAANRKDAAGEVAVPTTHVSGNFVAASVTIAVICGVWELLGDGPPWSFAVAAHLTATIVITVCLRRGGTSQ